MKKIKPKFKFRLRLRPFLFILNEKVFYEDGDDGYCEVYELFKLVFPFVYKYTGTWTIHERGRPFDYNKLKSIIEKYKVRGYV